MFAKATKKQAKLRAAYVGASGSGKTRSAIETGHHLGGPIALIDTEQGSASKYADVCDFDVMEISDDFHPNRCVEAIQAASSLGYGVLIIDSLTHFWNGNGGFLDLVDQEVKKSVAKGRKADSFAAWKDVTPIYNRLVHAILSAPLHVIVTLRAKQEFAKENGKIEKLGMAPEFRDGFSYNVDVEGLLDQNHNMVILKTRCEALDGKVFHKPGKEFADYIKAWLSDGAVTPVLSWEERIAACGSKQALEAVRADMKRSGAVTDALVATWKAREAEVGS